MKKPDLTAQEQTVKRSLYPPGEYPCLYPVSKHIDPLDYDDVIKFWEAKFDVSKKEKKD